jgi:hypothetical protein
MLPADPLGGGTHVVDIDHHHADHRPKRNRAHDEPPAVFQFPDE